jgi:hypothetical protein
MKKAIFILVFLILGVLLFGCTEAVDNSPQPNNQTNIENQTNDLSETYPTGQGNESLLDLLPKEQGNLIYSTNLIGHIQSGKLTKEITYQQLKSAFSYGCNPKEFTFITYDYGEATQIIVQVGETDDKESAIKCLDGKINLIEPSSSYYFKDAQINNNSVKEYIWKNYADAEQIQSIIYTSNNKIIHILTDGGPAYSLTNPEQQLPELFKQLFQNFPSD